MLHTVAGAHPDIYVKSHAGRSGADLKFRVTLSASAANACDAENSIESTRADMVRQLAAKGIDAAYRGAERPRRRKNSKAQTDATITRCGSVSSKPLVT